jgi:hypothetical protein
MKSSRGLPATPLVLRKSYRVPNHIRPGSNVTQSFVSYFLQVWSILGRFVGDSRAGPADPSEITSEGRSRQLFRLDLIPSGIGEADEDRFHVIFREVNDK